MKDSFRSNLKHTNSIAKKANELNKDSDSELDDVLRTVLDFHKDDMLENENISFEAQEKIFVMQREKQLIMDWLKDSTKKIDDNEGIDFFGEKSHKVSFENGDYLCGSVKLTKGDLMSAIEWGIYYDLDDSCDRSVRRKYLVECARNKISSLFDGQVSASEIPKYDANMKARFISLGVDGDYGDWLDSRLSKYGDKRLDYRSLSSAERDEKKDVDKIAAYRSFEGPENLKQDGVMAEKMLRSFFKKISYDNDDLNFSFKGADAYQDVNQKIDFILRRKNKLSAVSVDDDYEIDDSKFGLQFTLQKDTSGKDNQLRIQNNKISRLSLDDTDDGILLEIEKLILVKGSGGGFKDAYTEWKDGEYAFGPERLMKQSFRKKVFFDVLSNVFKNDEVESEWRKVVGPEQSLGKVA
jgi:hypothetical protein